MPQNKTSTHTNQVVTVSFTDPAQEEAALAFARQHHLACREEPRHIDTPLYLCFTPDRLELRETQTDNAIYVDFTAGAVAHRRRFGGGRGQTIAKAVGLKQSRNPKVLDATAGLGRDSFVLASLGCSVTLVERSPIVHALLLDGIKRGILNDETGIILKQHFDLILGDAIHIMETLPQNQKPAVIYLDPMYPVRRKSAKVKKEMQLLQQLLGHQNDVPGLLSSALMCAQQRVVVKRPKGAPPVDGPLPSFCIESKSTRFDVYVTG